MTVTDKQMVEAQLKTAQSAMDLLESVAALGDAIAFQVKKGNDIQKDEFVEVRMKSDHFRGLIEMFLEVSEWVSGLVSIDPETVNAD